MSSVLHPVRLSGGVGLSCVLLMAFCATSTHAADASPTVTATSSVVSLLQVMFGLGLVLAAIAGTAWLLKRLGPGQSSDVGALRVVAGVAVGPKERVVLVDVGDTRLVLGVAPGHVSTLHQMPRPAGDDVRTSIEPVTTVFQEKLKTLLKGKGSVDAA